LISIEEQKEYEKMKEDVTVPVVVLPRRGNQEFYFATDIARWSGLEKANRLYDRCPLMGCVHQPLVPLSTWRHF